MKLLETVETLLGTFDVWPSYILQHIFNDHPSPVASDRLKVIAFFYGNGVPCFIALGSFKCVTERHLDLRQCLNS
jgi:hypothetical protein